MTTTDITQHRPLLDAIAAHLGAGWTATTTSPAGGSAAHGYLAHTDGTSLVVTQFRNQPGRLTFRGHYPKNQLDLNHDLAFFVNDPTFGRATASVTRPPAAIARQLRTKVLPAVWSLTGSLAAFQSARAARLAFIARLAPAGAVPDQGTAADRASLPGGSVAVAALGTSGTLTLNNLTAEQMLDVLTTVDASRLAAVVAMLLARPQGNVAVKLPAYRGGSTVAELTARLTFIARLAPAGAVPYRGNDATYRASLPGGSVAVALGGTSGTLTLNNLTAEQMLDAVTAVDAGQLAAVVAMLLARPQGNAADHLTGRPINN